MDVTAIIHSIGGHDHCWTTVKLPHLLIDSSETTKNHWYYKPFQWKCSNDVRNESIAVPRFQSDDSNEVEMDRLAVWLNNGEIFSELVSSREISIPFSSDRLIETNTWIIHCAKYFALFPGVSRSFQWHSDGIPVENQSCLGLADPIVHRDSWEQINVPRLNIVMLIVGTRGDVQPFIAFGQRLLSAGHRVRLATHEKFRSYVREHQLEFYPLAFNPDELMSFVVKNGGIVPSVSSIIEGDAKKKRRDIAAILASTWKACVKPDDETSLAFRAEVIIANPPSFGHVHCAQKLQTPLHMMFTMPWSATSAFPHAFCHVDYSKASREKLNLLSSGVIETLVSVGFIPSFIQTRCRL
jgi:hypothetical protein